MVDLSQATVEVIPNSQQNLSDDYVNSYVQLHESAGRETQKWEHYIEDHIDHRFVNSIMPENSSILYLGCGTGGFFHFFSRASRIVGVDRSIEMVNVAKKPPNAHLIPKHVEIEILLGHSDQLQLGSRKFDVIYAHPFSAYMPITRKRLVHLGNFLNPNGMLVFHFPYRHPNTSRESSFPMSTIKRLLKAAVDRFAPDRYLRIYDPYFPGGLKNLCKRIKTTLNIDLIFDLRGPVVNCLVFQKQKEKTKAIT